MDRVQELGLDDLVLVARDCKRALAGPLATVEDLAWHLSLLVVRRSR
jgi:hypothetical protein